MSDDKKNKPVSQWKLIAGTATACAGLFAWFHTHTLSFKDAEIALLERQVEQLSDVGAVPQAVRHLAAKFDELRDKVSPLLAVTRFDPITGRMKFGGMDSPTDLSRAFSATLTLIKEKKYDIALAEADRLEELSPGFTGSTYLRYLVNKDKQFEDEAANLASSIVAEIPDDMRIKEVYSYLANYHLRQGAKQEAEAVTLKALGPWPEDEVMKESFRKIFGYVPSRSSAGSEGSDGN